ncbi:MAG TPA: hypothetical protein VJV03_11755 [Pyrinomonadaceae bacterium]|nr:hypothetical protein [Pyrinomonadaceae bacterium]
MNFSFIISWSFLDRRAVIAGQEQAAGVYWVKERSVLSILTGGPISMTGWEMKSAVNLKRFSISSPV